MIIVGILITITGILLTLAFIIGRITCSMRAEATVSKILETSITMRGRKLKEYTPEFTYIINGKTFTDKAETPSRKKDKYIVGQKVTVYVNPKHPEKTWFGNNLGFLFLGLAAVVIGAGLIFLSVI